MYISLYIEKIPVTTCKRAANNTMHGADDREEWHHHDHNSRNTNNNNNIIIDTYNNNDNQFHFLLANRTHTHTLFIIANINGVIILPLTC